MTYPANDSQPDTDTQLNATKLNTKVEVICGDRWQAYRRFKDLDICCECRAHQPLRVQVDNANQLLQVWSVLQRVAGDRASLVERLDRAWQLAGDRARTLPV